MPTATQPISLKPRSGSTYYPRKKTIQTPPFLKPEKPPDDLNDLPEPEIEYLKKAGKLKVEEAEYWEKYYDNTDENYEWNNGYLEVKPVSDILTNSMHVWFTQLMNHYLETRQNGQIICLEMGFRLVLPSKTVIRKPDYGIVLHSNPVPLPMTGKTHTYPGICDLCVEALSDSKPQEIKRDTETKFREYAAGGVKEYYIVYANDEELMGFYRLNAWGVYVPIEPVDNLIKSLVLPGFQFCLDDLYRQPSLKKIACDPVYEKFAFPAYKKALQQVEQERQEKELALQRADQECREKERERQEKELALQRAEQERQEKELAQKKVAKMTEQLRKLGIDPLA
jgi:hypothetical protein